MLVMAEYRMIQERLVNFMGISDEIFKEIETMEIAAKDLDIFWDGEANAEYLLNVSADLLNAKLLIQKVKRCGNFLAYSLSRYQSSERQIYEMIEGLN